MRILALSSLYPPHHVGGYELCCRDVMERLEKRGHQVSILTSTYGLEHPQVEGNVYRLLDYRDIVYSQLEPILPRARRELKDNRLLKDLLLDLRPDIVTVWDTWGLLKTLLVTLQRSGWPLLYVIASPWPIEYHQVPDRWFAFWAGAPSHLLRRWAKAALLGLVGPVLERRVPLRFRTLNFDSACFISQALKAQHLAAGLDCEEAPVVYWGIPLEQYPRRVAPAPGLKLRLLYAGRVVREKGVHTAIEALALLAEDYQDIRLDVVGSQPDEAYLASLQEAVAEGGLSARVNFVSLVPRQAMPEVYAAHDILLCPYIWEEPLGLTILEAMACGLPVVGTGSGGSGEVLVDGENSLLFPPGDSAALADRVRRLVTDSQLYDKIAEKASRTVHERFDVERMVERLEALMADSLVS
jgi:glycogen(starch) synthase